jgi:hypothetical protein
VRPAGLSITHIIIDCVDPERLASFWAEALGRPIIGRKGPYVWLERVDNMGLGFQRVDSPKEGKTRVHLDFGSEDPLLAMSRIEALGGTRVKGYEDGGFLVMTDPEGNEFCIVPREGSRPSTLGCDFGSPRVNFAPAPQMSHLLAVRLDHCHRLNSCQRAPVGRSRRCPRRTRLPVPPR